jgi:hypothetical protein
VIFVVVKVAQGQIVSPRTSFSFIGLIFIIMLLCFFKKRLIAQTVYTVCTGGSYKIVPLTNFNRYLRSETSEMEVSIDISVNNGSEEF